MPAFLDLVFEVREFVRRVFHLAEFLLNGLHLLIQVVLALALLHLRFDATADALLDLQHVDLALDHAEDLLESRFHVLDLEDALLLAELQRHVRGDRVGEAARLVDAGQRRQDLGRHLLVELHVLLELRNDRTHEYVDFAFIVAVFLGQQCDCGLEMVADINGIDQCAFAALDQNLDRAIRQFQQLQDRRKRANLIQISRLRIIQVRLFLRDKQDALADRHRPVERHDRFLAAHEQRDHHVRIDNDVAQRQNRNAGIVELRFVQYGRLFVSHRYEPRFNTLTPDMRPDHPKSR